MKVLLILENLRVELQSTLPQETFTGGLQLLRRINDLALVEVVALLDQDAVVLVWACLV